VLEEVLRVVVVVVKCWGSFSLKTDLAGDEWRDRHISRSFLECEKSLGGDMNGVWWKGGEKRFIGGREN
jgi:hypothetical protein